MFVRVGKVEVAVTVKRAFKPIENVAYFPLKKGCYLLLCRGTQPLDVFLTNVNKFSRCFHSYLCFLLRAMCGGNAKMYNMYNI